MTQEAVAHGAGISRNHYQLLEQGLSDRAKGTPANPALTTLIDIAKAMGLGLPDLLAGIVYPRKGDPVIAYAPAHGNAAPREENGSFTR